MGKPQRAFKPRGQARRVTFIEGVAVALKTFLERQIRSAAQEKGVRGNVSPTT
jgi:hypothetical protein